MDKLSTSIPVSHMMVYLGVFIFIGKNPHTAELVWFKPVLFKEQL